jgi:4-carboxymuconolactone decarboxylase
MLVDDTLYDAALKKVKEYRGENAELGHGPMAELAPEVDRLKDELLWGAIWSDSSIDIKTRSLCTISALMVLGIEEQLANHMQWALHCGVTPQQLYSLASQMMVYGGLPRGHLAMRLAKEAVEKAGLS